MTDSQGATQATPRPLLEVEALTKRFGGLLATDDFSLQIEEGEIHAVIGPNGAGKTTLVSQLVGELRSDSGRILFDGRDITRLPTYQLSAIGLARAFQITSIFLDFSVLDNTALAVQAHRGNSFRFWQAARDDRELREPALAALCRVGLDSRSDALAAELSHGEQRQLEIAMAIATGPRMLLLDEPTAGMSVEESARMVETLRELKKSHTMLLIEHDMDAVFALADRITVMVYGRAIATGAPDDIRRDPEVLRAYLGDGEA